MMLKRKVKSGAQALRNPAEETSRRRDPLLLFVGVLAFLMFAYGGFLTQQLLDPLAYPVSRIAVEGEFQHLTAEHVERVVSGAIVGGFFSVDVADVRRRILDEPWVFDASVRRVWPDTIRVSIEEQHPVARWGEYALLNRYADIFVPDADALPAGLVQLDGPIGTEAEILRRYVAISRQLSVNGLQVAGISLSDRRAWTVSLAHGATLVVGRDAVDARLDRFNRAFEAVLRAHWEHVASVDLRYTNGFAIKEKPGDQDNG